MWQVREQEQRVDEHVALRVKLGRLFHAFHGGDFREYFLQEPDSSSRRNACRA